MLNFWFQNLPTVTAVKNRSSTSSFGKWRPGSGTRHAWPAACAVSGSPRRAPASTKTANYSAKTIFIGKKATKQRTCLPFEIVKYEFHAERKVLSHREKCRKTLTNICSSIDRLIDWLIDRWFCVVQNVRDKVRRLRPRHPAWRPGPARQWSRLSRGMLCLLRLYQKFRHGRGILPDGK